MVSPLVQLSLACGFVWFLWKYFHQIVLKSPLDNVPGPARQSFLYGNLPQLVNRLGWGFFQDLTDNYNPGVVKLHAPFGHRMLYVYDPIALHSVVVKDQHAYEEAQWFTRSYKLTLGPGLLAATGNQHKKQRKLLGPALSMAHTKRMVPLFNDVGRNLQRAVSANVGSTDKAAEIDVLAWSGRTTLELIGQAGLGYSFDPLVSKSADEYGIAVKLFQPSLSKINVIRRFVPYLPDYALGTQRKIMDIFGSKDLHDLAEVCDVIKRRSTEVYEEKKRALELGDEALKKQIGEGRDIMSILMRLNMNAAEEDKISEEEIVGQMATFIFAAMDTTSNTLAVTLSLLAEHPEVQEKLRNEILGAFDPEDDYDYDTLMSLPYLEAVCRESLRLHPPISVVTRETTQDIIMPLSVPMRGVDGTIMNQVPVPKDTTIVVAIHSANRNKTVWGEDALEWKPERWLSPLPSSVTDAKIPGIYTNLMSFGGGGHACIGFKFAQLGLKSILCRFLSKFTFAPSNKEIVWILAGIRFPTVGGGPHAKPELPVMVSHYHRETEA